jgi:hypothetical protein
MRPAVLPARLLILIASLVGLFSLARADDVAMPTGATADTAAPAPVTTPTRGVTMNKVEAQFGAPTERHAAVGKPAITRWDYPAFSVFFENDHVIHSVIR